MTRIQPLVVANLAVHPPGPEFSQDRAVADGADGLVHKCGAIRPNLGGYRASITRDSVRVGASILFLWRR